MRPRGGGSVNQKKLVTGCSDCNRFGRWSGHPVCPARDRDKHDAQARMTSSTLGETVHVHSDSFCHCFDVG